ncbi:MAG: hypothetical protein PHI35_03330 [Victivallaceae bacterium]|nr:hypothetical protein [Victivallaceae bacterium]
MPQITKIDQQLADTAGGRAVNLYPVRSAAPSLFAPAALGVNADIMSNLINNAARGIDRFAAAKAAVDEEADAVSLDKVRRWTDGEVNRIREEYRAGAPTEEHFKSIGDTVNGFNDRAEAMLKDLPLSDRGRRTAKITLDSGRNALNVGLPFDHERIKLDFVSRSVKQDFDEAVQRGDADAAIAAYDRGSSDNLKINFGLSRDEAKRRVTMNDLNNRISAMNPGELNGFIKSADNTISRGEKDYEFNCGSREKCRLQPVDVLRMREYAQDLAAGKIRAAITDFTARWQKGDRPAVSSIEALEKSGAIAPAAAATCIAAVTGNNADIYCDRLKNAVAGGDRERIKTLRNDVKNLAESHDITPDFAEKFAAACDKGDAASLNLALKQRKADAAHTAESARATAYFAQLPKNDIIKNVLEDQKLSGVEKMKILEAVDKQYDAHYMNNPAYAANHDFLVETWENGNLRNKAWFGRNSEFKTPARMNQYLVECETLMRRIIDKDPDITEPELADKLEDVIDKIQSEKVVSLLGVQSEMRSAARNEDRKETANVGKYYNIANAEIVNAPDGKKYYVWEDGHRVAADEAEITGSF